MRLDKLTISFENVLWANFPRDREMHNSDDKLMDANNCDSEVKPLKVSQHIHPFSAHSQSSGSLTSVIVSLFRTYKQ